MKYTYCETLMWHALTPALFRWLKEGKPDWDMAALKREVYCPLSPVRPVRLGTAGKPAPSGAPYVCAGYALRGVDGRRALPHQDAGHRRGLLRLLYV